MFADNSAAIRRPAATTSTLHWLLLFLASTAAVLPLVLRGPSCGHDFDFHLLSWIETAADWRQGLVYPHWLVSANYGAGEPRFVFYPPLSWFLGAVLGTLAGLLGPHIGWTAAPILLTWIALFAAGCAVYGLARDFASSNSAAIAACLFIANPYLLFVAYERTAYAELLSTALIALLLRFALRTRMAIVPLALIVAGLWLMNAPAAVMGCYTLAFLALLRVLFERSAMPAWRAGLSCVAGTSLAGFYLVPAAYEQRWVQIERAVSEGMRVQDSFLFEHTGQLYHDQVLHIASTITLMLASIGFVAIVAAWRKQQQRRILVTLTTLLAALLFLQLRVSDIAWRMLPRLQFLQFPWRWLVVISIVAAVAVALALAREKLLVAAPVAAIVVAGSLWICTHRFYQQCDVDDSIDGQLSIFHSGAGVEGTDEYTARGADNSEVLQDIPQVRVLTNADAELPAANAGDNPEWISDWAFPTTAKATFKVTAWQPQHRSIQIDAAAPAFAVLTLMDYPAWQVTLNGRLDTDHGHREDGLIALAVPAGRSTIDVRWKNTPDIDWGRLLTALAAVLLLINGIASSRQRRGDSDA